MALWSWVLAVLLAGLLLLPTPALAAPASADFPVAGGHFYSEANGQGGGAGQPGFAILDHSGIPFWTAFRQGGGVNAYGYPISRPFPLDGDVIATLPQFGTVTFTKASVVIGGVHGAISNPAWQAWSETLDDNVGSVEAAPSALSPDGSGFQVAWCHS